MSSFRQSVFLLFFLFFYSLLFHSGHFFPQDDEIRFRLTESLVLRQDFAIEPVRGFGTKTGLDGREYSQYGPGLSMLAIPLYSMGRLTYPLVKQSLIEVYRHDTMRFHPPELSHFWIRHWVSIFNHMIFALIGMMLFLIGKHLTGNSFHSAVMSIIFICASFVFPYSRTFFSEPTVSFLFLWVFYLSLFPITWKTAFLSGLITGMALLVRQDSILWAFLFLFFFVRLYGLKNWRKLGFTIFIITLFGSFLLYLNYRHYGNPFITGYEAQEEGIAFTAPLLISLYGFIFSTGRSIFLYSPVLIAALIALPRLKKILSKNHFFFLISTIIVYFLFYSTWQNWAGGWDWGPRHIYICVPLLGIAFLLYPLQSIKQKFLFIILMLSGFFIQFLGSISSFIDYYTYYLQSFKNILPDQFYQALFVPDLSSLAGHWWLLQNGYIDIWWYQLLRNSSLTWVKILFPLLNFVLVILFFIFMLRSLSPFSSSLSPRFKIKSSR